MRSVAGGEGAEAVVSLVGDDLQMLVAAALYLVLLLLKNGDANDEVVAYFYQLMMQPRGCFRTIDGDGLHPCYLFLSLLK